MFVYKKISLCHTLQSKNGGKYATMLFFKSNMLITAQFFLYFFYAKYLVGLVLIFDWCQIFRNWQRKTASTPKCHFFNCILHFYAKFTVRLVQKFDLCHIFMKFRCTMSTTAQC